MSIHVQKKLWAVILSNTLSSESEWLEQRSQSTVMELMTGFVAAPRFLRKTIIQTKKNESAEEFPSPEEISVTDWSLVRLCRVWLLLKLEELDPKHFKQNIETLFDTAEINELVALYSALPVLSSPEQWLFRATDAVRSNMGLVFDAIALRNPYPSKYFSDQAWNQLVLKTIFNDKPIHLIMGLDRRKNEALAHILSDFAHERWAAGRVVAPEVWRLTGPYMNEKLLQDMKALFASSSADNHRAAALACGESTFPPALALLEEHPELAIQIKTGTLNWSDIEFKELNTYVPQP
ncbi:EboA domain-containing protein [Dyadobacter tibetensis]|uniref:EboA domain-containing protein n=1 Tax=Dyadobacter tibetensis TaxID=1211851 RepID=UPI0004708D6B|nr:EboA domain-containing protein [Dyadobacter tibetensis]